MLRLDNFYHHFIKKIFIRKKGGIATLYTFTILFSTLFLLSLLSVYYIHEKQRLKLKEIPKEVITLPQLFVEAKSFVVYDGNTGRVLLSKADAIPRPLASLTKIQTAYLYAKRNGTHNKITIPDLGLSHIYDFSLKKGDIWESEDLIKFMLTISSNDAAEILARSDALGRDNFIALMNTVSSSTSFRFTTPNGLDEGNKIGGLGTALDMAKLLRKFYQEFPDLFEATNKTDLTVTINGQKYTGIPNTNRDVESYIGVTGSKTGFTDKAGGNLAVLYDESLGHPLIVVILGSTKEGRFSDMKKILFYIKEYGNELYLREQ